MVAPLPSLLKITRLSNKSALNKNDSSKLAFSKNNNSKLTPRKNDNNSKIDRISIKYNSVKYIKKLE